MTLVPIGPKQCEKTRKYLDSYISNELTVETNHDVLKHLENCSKCSHVLQDLLLLRNRLREAVKQEVVPAALRERVERSIRQQRTGLKAQSWSRWSLATAAVLIICFGTFHLWELNQRPRVGISLQADLPATTTNQIAALLKIGVGDHIHCVVEHHDDREQSTSEEMAKELGPDYFGLVALVNERLPKDYSVSVAHQCHVNGRRFVHLIFKNQQNVLSLVITKKGDEGFPVQDGVAAMSPRAPQLHQDQVEGYDAVGFETQAYLAFVVSSLDKNANLQIASNLVPAVNTFLANLSI
jgi:putative zinc finger protein